MGRPRAFDEDQAVAAATELFARHGYEGTSIDDLVTALGVHRGSLYKVFGSKRGLYLAALRRHIERQVLPVTSVLTACSGPGQALASAAAAFDSGPAAGLLLLAQAERAPHDPDVAALTAHAFGALDEALRQVLTANGVPARAAPPLATALSAAVTGLRLRSRTAGEPAPPANGPDAVVALADLLSPTPSPDATGA